MTDITAKMVACHDTDTEVGSDWLGLVPTPPNSDGESLCTVRWIVETPGGWLGSWDRAAFAAYIAAAVAAERERLLAALGLMGGAALDAVRDDWTAGYARGIGACEEVVRGPNVALSRRPRHGVSMTTEATPGALGSNAGLGPTRPTRRTT